MKQPVVGWADERVGRRQEGNQTPWQPSQMERGWRRQSQDVSAPESSEAKPPTPLPGAGGAPLPALLFPPRLPGVARIGFLSMVLKLQLHTIFL